MPTITTATTAATTTTEVSSFEGDCLEVLPVLAADGLTADLAYIDPPYNVGVWGHYLDRRGDWDDWLKQRLVAALATLAPHASVVISVGDEMLHRLRLMADEVLGAKNYLGTVHWIGSSSPAAHFHGGGVDHLVLYAVDRDVLSSSGRRFRVPLEGAGPVLAAGARAWADHPGDPSAACSAMRAWWRSLPADHESLSVPGLRRYMRIDDQGRLFRGTPLNKPRPSSGHHYPILHPITKRPCPVPENGWRAPEATMRDWAKAGELYFGPDETTIPQRKTYLIEVATRSLPATITHRRDGTSALAELIGPHSFPYPKDPEVLTWLFGAITSPGDLILDFFAGSGTTAQSVADLNEADRGDRSVVLVTNEESYQPYLRPRLAALAARGSICWADNRS